MPDKVKMNSQVYHSYWSSIPAELRKVTDSTTPTKTKHPSSTPTVGKTES